MIAGLFHKHGRLWAAGLLTVATVAVYSRVLRHDFVNYDDGAYVTENLHVKNGFSPGNVAWAFTSSHSANWHPLTWLSHMLDCQIYGLEPAGHHLTSLLLHLANALLLLFLLERMTGALLPSAFVASLFALHPLHVESVAWVAERKDVLSTLFWILTIWAYAWYAGKPGAGRYVAALLLFVLGLCSKPMLVTLPFVLLLLDFWPLGRVRVAWRDRPAPEAGGAAASRGAPSASVGQLLLEKVPFFALTIVSSAITILAQRGAGALASADEVPVKVRVANALVSYVGYLGKTIWPSRLAIFYPLPAEFPLWQVAGAGLLVVVVSAAAIGAAGRRPYLAVGWLWYLGTLVPVLGLVQVGLQSMADRYTYVPLIGVFIVIAWGAKDLAAGSRHGMQALAAAAPIALLACAVLTFRQLRFWQNSNTLFEGAFETTANNYVTHYHFANVLAGQGKMDEAIIHYKEALRLKPDAEMAHNNLGLALAIEGRTDEASEHYEEALRIKPDLPEAHNNLGSLLGKQGRRDEAMGHFEAALRYKPDFAEAHNNLGVALGNQGKLDEAIAHFREALRIKPDFVDALNDLGYVLGRKGKLDEAIAQFSEALRLDPGSALAHYYMGAALSRQRKVREAIAHYREAIRLNPNSPEALNNLALILATDDDPRLRNGTEAVLLAERACELTGHQDVRVLITLAAAYAEAGRFVEAVESAQRALDIAVSSDQKSLAEEIQGRLDHYKAQLPRGKSSKL